MGLCGGGNGKPPDLEGKGTKKESAIVLNTQDGDTGDAVFTSGAMKTGTVGPRPQGRVLCPDSAAPYSPPIELVWSL